MTNLNTNTASISELKLQAKRLRTRLLGTGVQISHSQSLELIAQQNGVRDWNTLHAQIGNRPVPPKVGDRVTGRYLGQPFAGLVRGMVQMGDQFRITLHFDAPVDVVTFDSFSAFRQRVSGLINADGVSPRKTSNGEPQLIVDPPAV